MTKYKTLNIYTVNYWIPFPASEYGGLYVIAANDVDEVVRVALEATSGWDKDEYEAEWLVERIKEGCTVIGTSDLFEEPCVIESFWT